MKIWYLTVTVALLTSLLPGTKVLAQSPAPEQTNPRSGCLSGYPDGTYRGDRAITRNEFAAGLNACLQQVDQSIRTNREPLATRADFGRLIQRQRELNDQLSGLNNRVDTLSK